MMALHDQDDALGAAAEAVSPALQIDPAKYMAELDAFDITEAQKQELLQTLWSIMRSFVELGFTVDVCGALLAGTLSVTGDGEAS